MRSTPALCLNPNMPPSRRRVYKSKGIPGRQWRPQLQVRVGHCRAATGHGIATQHRMVTDNEPDVVDCPTNDKTPFLHENSPTRRTAILHDHVQCLGGLPAFLKHRPIRNRPPLFVGHTTARRLDAGHGAINLRLSVTSLPANKLEKLRRPTILQPDVKLEPLCGGRTNVHPTHTLVEPATQIYPRAGHIAFYA